MKLSVLSFLTKIGCPELKFPSWISINGGTTAPKVG